MKDASGLKASEAKCSRAIAATHCVERFPSFELATIADDSEALYTDAALCRNTPGSAKLISITGSGSVPGAGGRETLLCSRLTAKEHSDG
jgi:hypothetical protein